MIASKDRPGLAEEIWRLLQRDLAHFPLERLTDGSCIPLPETAKVCQVNINTVAESIRFSALISFDAQPWSCCGEPPEPDAQQAWMEAEIMAAGQLLLVEDEE